MLKQSIERQVTETELTLELAKPATQWQETEKGAMLKGLKHFSLFPTANEVTQKIKKNVSYTLLDNSKLTLDHTLIPHTYTSGKQEFAAVKKTLLNSYDYAPGARGQIKHIVNRYAVGKRDQLIIKNERYVEKVIKPPGFEPQDHFRKKVNAEYEITKRFNKALGFNIPRPTFITTQNKGLKAFLAIPYIPGEELSNFIHKRYNSWLGRVDLPLDRVFKILSSMYQQLLLCLENQIIHADFTLNNLRVDEQDNVRLYDFDASYFEGKRPYAYGARICKPLENLGLFLSPFKPSTYKADIFAAALNAAKLLGHNQIERKRFDGFYLDQQPPQFEPLSHIDYEFEKFIWHDTNFNHSRELVIRFLETSLADNPDERPNAKKAYNQMRLCALAYRVECIFSSLDNDFGGIITANFDTADELPEDFFTSATIAELEKMPVQTPRRGCTLV